MSEQNIFDFLAGDSEMAKRMHEFDFSDTPLGPVSDGIGTAIDITGRKAAGEALRYQANILQIMDDAVIAFDTYQHVTYWSPGAQKMYGWTEEEALGKTPDEILRPLQYETETLQDKEARQAAFKKGEIVQGENIQRRKDGLEFWVDYHSKAFFDSNGILAGFITIQRDITGRKLAEKALRESERKYQELMKFTPVAIYEVDLRTQRFLSVNDTMCRLSGYDREELLAMNILDLLNDQSKNAFKERQIRWLNGEYPEPFVEFKVVRKDGHVIDALLNMSFIFDENGRPIGATVIAQDITERKRAEETLRESERVHAFQASILESVRDPMWVTDSGLRIVYWNDAATAEFGWTADEAMGQHTGELFRTLVPGLTREEAVEKARRTGDFFGECVIRCKDGRPIIIEARCHAVRGPGGEVVRFVNTVRDITERKKMEEALINERKRLFDVLETLPVMICLITPDYHIPFVNKAFREKFGEANGRCCYDYCCGFSEPCTFCESLTPLKTGQAHNWEFTSPNGNTIIDAYDFPFSDIDGSPLILEMDVDITERKRAEGARQESEKRALALVGELKKADENKNHFISVLSHELRNPLAAISAGVQLLDITQDKKQTEKVKEIINRQMHQLCKLVDDLLELTRITQNKIKLKKEIIDLNEIVKSTATDIRLEYEKKGTKLGTKIQTKPVLLSADPMRVTQIIGNILTNALKFTQENGEVKLTLKTEKNNAVISIKDNGIGISPEILPRLFTPFTQADNSLDRSSGGLGLGLSIVKGIVDLHDGSVSAYSEGLGKGSTFTIRLPITTGDNLVMESLASGNNGKKSLKLLIIEDNRDFAGLLSTMLSTIGHHVDIAYDGIEGMKLAKQIKPDVIFCDIGLPGMNGYDVAENIRKDNSIKDTHLIALTGYAGEGDAKRILKAGFDKHLPKPVDFKALKTMLKKV